MVNWPLKGLSDLQLGDKKATLDHLVLTILPMIPCESCDWNSRIPSDFPPNKHESHSTRLGFDSNGLRFGDSQDEFEKIQEAYEKLGSAFTWIHENCLRVLQAANKVLGTTVVNPLIRPYNFMGGSWRWEGVPLDSHDMCFSTVRCSMLEMQRFHKFKWFKRWMESWISPLFPFILRGSGYLASGY